MASEAAVDAAAGTERRWKSGSRLERVLAAGEFAVTAEVGPPRNHDIEVVRRKAALVRDCADAVNVTDNQTAVVRLSSIAASVALVGEGLEPVVQMTCRDRNRLAMQSDLLGAAALGIRNVLCLSGDHQSMGNHPGAKNVHDIDSLQLVSMVRAMRDEGVFQCGDAIPGGGPPLLVGAAANPFGDPEHLRPYRLAKKAAAGADFVQTQLVYDVERFRRYMEKVVSLGVADKCAVLAGVGPLKSAGMARHMRDRVPGMRVADEYVERMEHAVDGIDAADKAGRRDAWREEGIRICVEIIEQVREIPGVRGVHIMAIEWEEAVRPICERAGLLPRPEVVAA